MGRNLWVTIYPVKNTFEQKPSYLPKVADYAAPAVYWSFIETSLAVVCACLPTIRPIFNVFSLKSLLQSLRGKSSAHSERNVPSFSRQLSPGIESTSSVARFAVKHDTNAGPAYGPYQVRTEEFRMVQSPSHASSR